MISERFEKVDGYNAIKDNHNLVYTLCEYEPKTYGVNEFDIKDMLCLLNTMNNEIISLKEQIRQLKDQEDDK